MDGTEVESYHRSQHDQKKSKRHIERQGETTGSNEVKKKSGLGHSVENHKEVSNIHKQSTKDLKAPGSTYRTLPYPPR